LGFPQTSFARAIIVKNILPLVLFVSTCFLSGCVTVSYQTRYTEPGFQIKDLLTKRVEVVFGNNLVLNSYEKAFAKTYINNEGYFKSVQLSIVSNLALSNSNVDTGSSEESTPMLGLVSLNEQDVQKARDYFSKSTSELILFIKEVTIQSEITSNYAPPSQPGMAGSNTSSESCKVTLVLETWDTKKQKKMYEFSTTDKAGVFLFSYSASLAEATKKTTQSAVDYIAKNGRY